MADFDADDIVQRLKDNDCDPIAEACHIIKMGKYDRDRLQGIDIVLKYCVPERKNVQSQVPYNIYLHEVVREPRQISTDSESGD